MFFRYVRALFVGEKTVEFYWNAAGVTGCLLLLGSVVMDKENFDVIFGENKNIVKSGKAVGPPGVVNPLDDDKKQRN